MDSHVRVAAISGLAGSWVALLASSVSAATTTTAPAAPFCAIPVDAPATMTFRCIKDPTTGAAVVVVASFGGESAVVAAARAPTPAASVSTKGRDDIIRVARAVDQAESPAAAIEPAAAPVPPATPPVQQASAVNEIAATAQQVANSAKQTAAAADDAAKAHQALADQAKNHATAAQAAADAAAGSATKADAQKNLEKAKGAAGATDSAAKSANAGKSTGVEDIYIGTGLAVTFNIGSERADDVKFIKTVTNGTTSVLAQIQKSQDVNIGLLGEVHYLFKDRFITRATAGSDFLPNLALCGPWAFVKLNSNETTGCGPLAVAAFTSDGSNTATQFGLGWALGLGGSSTSKPGIGLGMGFLVDPSNKVVDHNIIDPATNTVRPPFVDGVLAGTTSVLVSRPTYSWFFLVSKAFN